MTQESKELVNGGIESMDKWQYKILTGLSSLDKEILTELGLEGWELCAYDSEWRKAIFKRKIVDE